MHMFQFGDLEPTLHDFQWSFSSNSDSQNGNFDRKFIKEDINTTNLYSLYN